MMNARFELFVEDIQRSSQFYENILEFVVTKRTKEYIGLANDNVKIGLGAISDLPSNHPLCLNNPDERKGVGIEIVLEVDDVAELYGKIRTFKYPISAPLMIQPWGLTDFRLVDPDGYYLRVTSKK